MIPDVLSGDAVPDIVLFFFCLRAWEGGGEGGGEISFAQQTFVLELAETSSKLL